MTRGRVARHARRPRAMAEMHWSDVMQSLPARAPAGELLSQQGPVSKPKARLAFNAAGLLVPASALPSRLEAVAAAPDKPRAGAACDDIRIGARPPLAVRTAPRARRAC